MDENSLFPRSQPRISRTRSRTPHLAIPQISSDMQPHPLLLRQPQSRHMPGLFLFSYDRANIDIHFPSDSWNGVGDTLYGNFKAIYKLRKER
ncbi:hypothetical protein FPV67DRAFT_450028 [Lyophyllum atratum]|nr:hypothetical protein FPV67DRAFT_450028 [Lyophyllum atratum]